MLEQGVSLHRMLLLQISTSENLACDRVLIHLISIGFSDLSKRKDIGFNSNHILNWSQL